jgi:Fe-S-cluster-containing dehydrogenase component
MQKQPDGRVTYDASRCIGCRYCMVACPFERLSYEYDEALTPRVRKCELCSHRTADGELPACVEICPVEALTYGKREELIAYAHERIAAHPDRYIDHVYGETEGGGTSWLYLADRPFTDLGFPALGPRSRAETTEAIQHGIFAGFAAPIGLFGLLAGLNFLTKRGRHE